MLVDLELVDPRPAHCELQALSRLSQRGRLQQLSEKELHHESVDDPLRSRGLRLVGLEVEYVVNEIPLHFTDG